MEEFPQQPKRTKGRPPKGQSAFSSANVESQILLHAKRLFRQKGYSAVSINDIVAAVGITKPTLYYYFKDKEHLFAAVLIQLQIRGKTFIEKGAQGETTLRGQLIRLMAGYFENSPTCLTSLIKDAVEQLGEDCRRQVFSAYQENILNPFSRLFQAALASGEIHHPNPDALAQTVVSMLDALNLSITVKEGRPFPYREKATDVVDVLMRGIQRFS